MKFVVYFENYDGIFVNMELEHRNVLFAYGKPCVLPTYFITLSDGSTGSKVITNTKELWIQIAR